MEVLALATADGPLGSAVGTTSTGTFGLGVGPVSTSVAVVVGGAFVVRSATTVWADWVWTWLTSWVSAGGCGADGPQALRIRLEANRRIYAEEIRRLMFLIMVFFP